MPRTGVFPPGQAQTAPDNASAPDVVDSQRAADTEQALKVAAKFGHPVADDSQTTETSEVSAMPDGSFSLQSDTLPVRVEKDGEWLSIDSSLQYGSDGMLAPAVSAAPVKFSEGGSNVMAKVEVDPGTWLTETWPYGSLPTPTVSDNDALYQNVLPDVDLRLSSSPAGMAEVLVVKSAAGAANPQVSQLRLGLDGANVTPGVGDTLVASPAGAELQPDSSASDSSATMSSSPVWWDSQTANSGPDGPVGSEEAHPVSQSATQDTVTLNVGDVVDSGKITYPLYVDPDWATGAQAYWFTDRAYPDTVYLNGNANSGGIQAVGYAGPTPNYLSHSFWQFDTSTLAHLHILSSSLSVYLAWSNSCTSTGVQAWVYGNGADQPGFTWNQEPNEWDTLLDTQTVSYGSSCTAPQWMGFNTLQGAVNAAAGGWPNIQIGLRAANESDPLTRKHFGTAATLHVTFNSLPAKPIGLGVSLPQRLCGTQATPAMVNGHQTVALYATVTDPDSEPLGTAFYVTDTVSHQNAFSKYGIPFWGTPSQSQGVQTATFDPDILAAGTYSWYAQATDYTDWGPVSDTCYLTVDNNAPSTPDINTTIPGSLHVGEPIQAQGVSATADHIAAFGFWWAIGSPALPSPSAPVQGDVGKAYLGPPIDCSSPGHTSIVFTQGMIFACADPATGLSPWISTAPIARDATLYVASWDQAGNVSAAATTTAHPAAAEVGASPSVGLSYSSGHGWTFDSSSALPSPIPDRNATVASTPPVVTGTKPLTVGAGATFTVATGQTAVKQNRTSQALTYPGYVELDRYYKSGKHLAVVDGFSPDPTWALQAAMGQMMPAPAVNPPAVPGMVLLYGCALPQGDMTSVHSDCEGTGITGVPMGYVWATQSAVPGAANTAVPVYRCYNSATGDHFDYPTADCNTKSLDFAQPLGYLANIGATKTASQAIDTSQSFTVSAWLKPASNAITAPGLTGNYTAMSEGGTNPNSAFYLQMAGGHWRFCVRSQSGNDVVDCAQDSNTATTDAWTLVTGIWDKSNNQVRLLVGASLNPRATATHIQPTGEPSAAGPLLIGSATSAGSPDNQWDGQIDDPVVFPGVIDTAQLTALVNLSTTMPAN